MKASRSRRELASETSISDTSADGNLGRISTRRHEIEQQFGHIFLPNDQVNEQQIERDELEPEVPNGLPNKQEGKQDQHPRVGHQQPPPPQHWADQTSITRPEPTRDLAAEQSSGCVAQIL